jgi:hypothetical protein
LNVQVLGISIDHIPSLQAWAESLGEITYPLLSDFWPHGEVAQRFGVLRDVGDSERAIFIVDQYGVIRYIDIHDIDEQPDNQVLFAELGKIDPGISAKLRAQQAAAEDEEIPEGGVVLYCTRWCPESRRTGQGVGWRQPDNSHAGCSWNDHCRLG